LTASCAPAHAASKHKEPALEWATIPGKVTITTGKAGYAIKIKKAEVGSYQGYFSGVADSASGNLARKMWFSKEKLGEPLPQTYAVKGITRNACVAFGVDIKLSFTHGTPDGVTTCKLDPKKSYYLNHQQYGASTGVEPTANSKMIRGASIKLIP
jgi:hypothetical protein